MDVGLAEGILLVAAGGAIGAVLRFSIGLAVDSSHFPWATFIVNVIGAFLLSLITFSYGGITTETRLFLFTGIFGAFTTMSTFSVETVSMFFDGRMGDALLNFILNPCLCVLGAVAGRMIAGLI